VYPPLIATPGLSAIAAPSQVLPGRVWELEREYADVRSPTGVTCLAEALGNGSVRPSWFQPEDSFERLTGLFIWGARGDAFACVAGTDSLLLS
jgi:hypothetical protein